MRSVVSEPLPWTHLLSAMTVDCGQQNKTGEGPGGKFNGPSLKTVLNNLNNLADILPNEGYPFIEYLQSIREVHHMCIAEVFVDNSEILIEEFKCKFDKLYKDCQ